MNNKCIYIATHKDFEYKISNCYKIIQVGADINKRLNYEGDNTGDNISKKNKNYCELTLLYWIWKNSNFDIIGLVHYRRYFFSNNRKNIISEKEIDSIMEKYDIILPQKKYIHLSNVKKQYAKNHNIDDFLKCRKCIEELYPEYVSDFDKISNSKKIYCYNMMICNKKLLNQYCEWLFSILFCLEQKINIEEYDDYNKRLFGFLSERLLNVWVLHNNLKVKEMPVYNVEKNIFVQKIKNVIHTLFWWL